MATPERPASTEPDGQRPAHIQHTESLKSAQIYSSSMVTLYVGRDKKPLFAHKAVLDQLAFFATCLAPDRFIEGQKMTIQLPDDEVKPIEQIIHFLYTGKLEYGPVQSSTPDSEATVTLNVFRDTYICAKKLMVEALCNEIVDSYMQSCNHLYWNLNGLNQLSQASLTDSPLFDFALKALAWELNKAGWNGILEASPNWEKSLREYPDISARLMKELLETIKSKPGRPDTWNMCQYHEHIQTPNCGTAKAGEAATKKWLSTEANEFW